MRKILSVFVLLLMLLSVGGVKDITAEELAVFDPYGNEDLVLQSYASSNIDASVINNIEDSEIGYLYMNEEDGTNYISFIGNNYLHVDIKDTILIDGEIPQIKTTIPYDQIKNLKTGNYALMIHFYIPLDKNLDIYSYAEELLKDFPDEETDYVGDDEKFREYFIYQIFKKNGEIFIYENASFYFSVKGEKVFGFYMEEDGKQYWYENGVKQGTYNDEKGIFGYDEASKQNINRGREIYDPETDGWYWLDSVYGGAKAVDKEVWVPYIYQNEDTMTDEQKRSLSLESNTYTEYYGPRAQISGQIYNAINNKTGKWVRYDWRGKMIKGWYKVSEYDRRYYPEQVGNVYFYDYKTGLMAKGMTVIEDSTYEFDSLTGVCKNPPEWLR